MNVEDKKLELLKLENCVNNDPSLDKYLKDDIEQLKKEILEEEQATKENLQEAVVSMCEAASRLKDDYNIINKSLQIISSNIDLSQTNDLNDILLKVSHQMISLGKFVDNVLELGTHFPSNPEPSETLQITPLPSCEYKKPKGKKKEFVEFAEKYRDEVIYLHNISNRTFKEISRYFKEKLKGEKVPEQATLWKIYNNTY
mgnify:CR=1 FL=1